MKNIYFIISALIAMQLNAQIINIPDANFKNKLLEADVDNMIAWQIKIDVNDDGEIQQSEALAVTHLWLVNSNISSLIGIEAFTNLVNLDCSGNSISALDVSTLNLQTLQCENSGLNTLAINEASPPTDLRLLNNNLTSFNFLHPGLSVFILSLSENPLTSVNLALAEVEYFDCDSTLLTELDLSQVTLGNGPFAEISITNNPNLQYLNLKNGHIDACTESDPMVCGSIPSVYNFNNPSLQFICVDEFELEYFPGASTYCTFSPGGNYNTISGSVTFDSDANGCTPTDTPVSGIMMEMSSGATILGNTTTNTTGSFTSYVTSGNQTIAPQSENPYYSFTPASFTSTFTGTGNTQTADFCLTANGVHPDLEVTILPMIPAQPGFDAVYRIICKNRGTEIQSGSVNLYFDDAVMDYVSATPTVASQATNTLSWDFSNLAPFNTVSFVFVMNINSPMETPPVNINDYLDFSANIASGTDETPNDNTAYFSQIVVGSYDPNDKTVIEGATITWMAFDDYLHYLVRFQNTGTAAATNVVIKDMLSDRLDTSTLEIVSASHDFRSTVTEGNKLEFFFENINLPAESVDEPGSHGYVAYKIKPAFDITPGDVIENTAEIYFDFNLPIITNTVTTTVSLLSVNELAASQFAIYPNPANNSFSISMHHSNTVESISVYNIIGQKVKHISENPNVSNIDISALKTGTYFIEIKTTQGVINKHLIKF